MCFTKSGIFDIGREISFFTWGPSFADANVIDSLKNQTSFPSLSEHSFLYEQIYLFKKTSERELILQSSF